ncbi:MAG: MerR family transcriptional regulator, partial [Acidimicrobiales bacterium]
LRQRLRAAGMLSAVEIAAELGVTPPTITIWQRRGAFTGRRVDGRRERLYQPGQSRPPRRPQQTLASDRRQCHTPRG